MEKQYRTLVFEEDEIKFVIAKYLGCDEEGIVLDDYSDQEIKDLLKKIYYLRNGCDEM